MNYPSNRIVKVVIYVLQENVKTFSFEYARPEVVADLTGEPYVYQAFDFKRKESVTLHLVVRNWRTHEPVELFRLDRKDVSKCLDRIWIVCQHFEF